MKNIKTTKKDELCFKFSIEDASLKVLNGNQPLGKSIEYNDEPTIIDVYFCDASESLKLYSSPINTPLYFKVYATDLVDKKETIHFITK